MCNFSYKIRDEWTSKGSIFSALSTSNGLIEIATGNKTSADALFSLRD